MGLLSNNMNTSGETIIDSNNTNGTVNRIHPDWAGYLLGLFIFLGCLSIATINVLFLTCFYRLRKHTFVKNGKTIISLIASDLINAIILTPTLLMWFTLPRPHGYSICVIKSVPFMVTNYISLLNISAFCIHRLISTKTLAKGWKLAGKSRYYVFTVLIWLFTPIVISVPYFTMGNVDMIMVECRRSIFKYPTLSSIYFSVLFDIPLIAMNCSFIALLVWFSKFKSVVATINHKTVNDVIQADGTNKVKLREGDNINKDNNKVLKATVPHFKELGVGQSRVITGGDINSIRNESVYMIESASNQSSDDYCEIVIESQLKPRSDNSLYEHIKTTKQHGVSFANQNVHYAERTCNDINCRADDADRICRLFWTGRNTEHNLIDQSTTIQAEDRTKKVKTENRCMVAEIGKSLVTTGILIAVYDVTTLPLILDVHIAMFNPAFLMPNLLNSMCFFTAICNPVVYLLRMKEMRSEMKLLMREFYNMFCCCRC